MITKRELFRTYAEAYELERGGYICKRRDGRWVVVAQAAAQEWQDAYNGTVEGQAFYEAAFADKCKEVHA